MRSKSKYRIHRNSSNDISAATQNDNIVTLTFLTLEERLRCLRHAAASKNANRLSHAQGIVTPILKSKEMLQDIDHSDSSSEQGCPSKELLVDMKFLFQSVFIFLRAPDPADPPHRVINRSLHWRVSICCVHVCI